MRAKCQQISMTSSATCTTQTTVSPFACTVYPSPPLPPLPPPLPPSHPLPRPSHCSSSFAQPGFRRCCSRFFLSTMTSNHLMPTHVYGNHQVSAMTMMIKAHVRLSHVTIFQ